MSILNEGYQLLVYVIIQTASKVLKMIERQHCIRDRIGRFRPVLRLQVQRDHLIIGSRILQPCQEIRKVIDRDCLPSQPSLVQIREIVLQKNARQAECIPCRLSIVLELQMLKNRFNRFPIIICKVIPDLTGTRLYSYYLHCSCSYLR